MPHVQNLHSRNQTLDMHRMTSQASRSLVNFDLDLNLKLLSLVTAFTENSTRAKFELFAVFLFMTDRQKDEQRDAVQCVM